MSDSLTRLVLRAQGRLPIAEPLLPSRCAPVLAPDPDDTAAGETTAVQLLSRSEPQREQLLPRHTQSPLRLPVTSPSVPRRAEWESPPSPEPGAIPPPTLEPIRVTRETPAAVPPSFARENQHDDTPSDRRAPGLPSGQLERPAPRPASDVLAAETYTPPRPGDRAPELPLRTVRTAPQTAVLPPASSGVPLRAVAPEVRISIGTVEVHAAPPRPSPVRPPPARRPTVSLADYLAQRSGKRS